HRVVGVFAGGGVVDGVAGVVREGLDVDAFAGAIGATLIGDGAIVVGNALAADVIVFGLDRAGQFDEDEGFAYWSGGTDELHGVKVAAVAVLAFGVDDQ